MYMRRASNLPRLPRQTVVRMMSMSSRSSISSSSTTMIETESPIHDDINIGQLDKEDGNSLEFEVNRPKLGEISKSFMHRQTEKP